MFGSLGRETRLFIDTMLKSDKEAEVAGRTVRKFSKGVNDKK